MPRVGNKHFPYTAKGRAAAKSYAKGLGSAVKGGASAAFGKMMSAGAGKNAKRPIGSAASKEPKTPRTGPAKSTVTPGERDSTQATERRREQFIEARKQRELAESQAAAKPRGRRRK